MAGKGKAAVSVGATGEATVAVASKKAVGEGEDVGVETTAVSGKTTGVSAAAGEVAGAGVDVEGRFEAQAVKIKTRGIIKYFINATLHLELSQILR